MSIKLLSSNWIRTPLTMISALLLGVSTFARADVMRFEITRVTPATFTQGEPIVLHYKIANDSAQYMTVNMGLDGAVGETHWVTQTLTSLDGIVSPSLTDPVPLDSGGLHFNRISMGPYGRKEGDLVASRCFSIPSSGEYKLNAQVDLSYGVGETDDASFANYVQAPTAFKQDFSFPLAVTAPDPKRLDGLAMSLEAAAEKAKDHNEQMLIVQELASLPEDQASSSWSKLKKNTFLSSWLALELGRRPTTLTADILSQLIWPDGATSKKHTRSAVSDQLAAMYNHSSGALKEHIRLIYAAHGIEAPDQFITWQNG
jgi:hypothetical protein